METLIAKLITGDRDAQQEFARTWEPQMRRVALSILGHDSRVDDVIQLALMKSFEKIGSFQNQYPDSLKAWVSAITRNLALTNYSRDKARQWEPLETKHLTTSKIRLLDDHLGDRELYEAAIHFIYNCLPGQQQKAVVYHLFEGMTFTEIGPLMGCCYDGAKANYRHGILKLRAHLQENFLDLPAALTSLGTESRV